MATPEIGNGEAGVPVRWRGLSSAALPPPGGGFGGPADSRRLVADFDDVIVVGIQGQADREAARHAIRQAIVAELADASGVAPERITLHSAEGQVPWAQLASPAGPRRAWLAISHDGELSVAAISLQGAVGIDVSRIEDIPDWEPVARDYLGPGITAMLAALPAGERALALARAWTEREARLKYFGRELVEWSDVGDRLLQACRCLPLDLPEGYVGALTLPPD
jgi:4'-phosphopantetheinyl transferase